MAKKRIDRDKIINAFLLCAFEKSAGAVSLADIAALLGVNKASLYNHFSSRDEIYEVAIDWCAQYMAHVQFIAMPYNASQSSDSAMLVYSSNDANAAQDEQLQQRVVASFDDALAHVIAQYFRSYELEPLFYMYTFIHSNKFFSKKAADAAQNEMQKIADGMVALVTQFNDNESVSLKSTQMHKEQHTVNENGTASLQMHVTTQPIDKLQQRAQFFAHALSAQLNAYIVHKKEMIRQNPESGAGSLFSLPSDDATLATIVANAAQYWSM
ncbi:MAG: TetR/AcrR family transcriptional regulator [Treponema sp.]|nr:TetR/AcrR family transcriptional regulator [Treponema sp.]